MESSQHSPGSTFIYEGDRRKKETVPKAEKRHLLILRNLAAGARTSIQLCCSKNLLDLV